VKPFKASAQIQILLLAASLILTCPAVACYHYYGEVYEYWRSAKRLEEQGNYQQAIAVYNKALNAAPAIKYKHMQDCAVYRTKARIEADEAALEYLKKVQRGTNAIERARLICNTRFREIIKVQNQLRPDLAHLCPL
jgi:tetratricopeptide (TPR) repeat protein